MKRLRLPFWEELLTLPLIALAVWLLIWASQGPISTEYLISLLLIAVAFGIAYRIDPRAAIYLLPITLFCWVLLWGEALTAPPLLVVICLFPLQWAALLLLRQKRWHSKLLISFMWLLAVCQVVLGVVVIGITFNQALKGNFDTPLLASGLLMLLMYWLSDRRYAKLGNWRQY